MFPQGILETGHGDAAMHLLFSFQLFPARCHGLLATEAGGNGGAGEGGLTGNIANSRLLYQGVISLTVSDAAVLDMFTKRGRLPRIYL